VNLLVLEPEPLVGQWIALPSGQVARVSAAYYGYLTRSGKDSIDITPAGGRRGIVLELAFTGKHQVRVGDVLKYASVKKVMRLRRTWWAVWFAMGTVPFTVAAATAYLLMTPGFFYMEGSERFVYIGIFGVVTAVTAVIGGGVGAILPRKPPPPAGSGAKNMRAFRARR